MKLLSIAIPCYNSSAYMRNCIDSLLPGGEDVEIIIVNDGSKDNTADIAEEYRERFPSIIKVINKENGGHGSAVNSGMEQATGLYFKVVDSDDWVNQSAYIQILNTLKKLIKDGKSIDMLISNFVYEKEGEKRKKVMKYHHALPQERVFTWNDVKHFRVGQYILMHSVIYRTNLLRECGLKLPEHTFYVDNIFVFNPLPYVKTMYYLDIITTVSSVLLIRSGLDENLEKKKELWKYIQEKDKWLWTRLRYGLLGNAMNLPGKLGRRISVDGYKICQRIFHFN
ncbi:MAG: glycosyltransferase family 2 protein [Lachnospiraceae bacterium]|nr:glycosyltransferase family 2 protein [Lachnospiraceae bacterium]